MFVLRTSCDAHHVDTALPITIPIPVFREREARADVTNAVADRLEAIEKQLEEVRAGAVRWRVQAAVLSALATGAAAFLAFLGTYSETKSQAEIAAAEMLTRERESVASALAQERETLAEWEVGIASSLTSILDRSFQQANSGTEPLIVRLEGFHAVRSATEAYKDRSDDLLAGLYRAAHGALLMEAETCPRRCVASGDHCRSGGVELPARANREEVCDATLFACGRVCNYARQQVELESVPTIVDSP